MANVNSYTLAENAGAGNGSAVGVKAGIYVLQATATFGGGSVKVQSLMKDGSTWVDVSGGSLTAAGQSVGLYLPAGQYRSVIATASAVYAHLIGVI